MQSYGLKPWEDNDANEGKSILEALAKNDGDEEKLEELMKKWTTVGREVAWEIWAAVKETIVPGQIPESNRSEWNDGEKQTNKFGDSWGWNGCEQIEEAEKNENGVKWDTMGAMLRQLGIDPDTLGWDEEEGEFLDHDRANRL